VIYAQVIANGGPDVKTNLGLRDHTTFVKMGDSNFFKGTSTDQDRRFKDKEAKLLKTLKFPPEFEQKVWAFRHFGHFLEIIQLFASG
jgi:hypothetical protein